MIGSILSSIMVLNNALVFGDTDINTDIIDNLDTIPVYKSPGIRQWGGRIANNTAYNFRHSDQNLFIENDEYTTPTADKTYDTDRNYVGKYFELVVGLSATAFDFPLGLNSQGDVFTIEWMQFTTTFQSLPFTSGIEIRALDSGGFTIRVTGGTTKYLLGTITELRKITGA